MKRLILCIGLGLLILVSCSENKVKKFRLVSSEESGITFNNKLRETVEFNIFNYLYFYNGAGVAVGDVNSDGLLDIYFTSNQNQNKLYLNKGNFKFQDVTERAGVAGVDGWKTGVTMADVNGDGLLDIYVCYLGDYLIYKGKNQLFINTGADEKGIPTFSDKAAEFGLDLVGFSTQASFFDYDRDGDLDMFMLNHSVHKNGTYAKSSLRYGSHPLAGDRLLRNDNGSFTDVTAEAGIYNSALGYGLGVVVSDVNLDGWPDIYVGNDFHENDYLYINQGNGKFSEELEKQMNHTSRYTMGVDFADFNNDAFPDLISMDMLPDDPQRLKASMAEDPYDVYNFKISFGYNHQFARNTLQLNNQNGTYSDIALLAGVYATDWSWATFFGDFDLDGAKDIYVANGISRRSNDLDYINFIASDSVQRKLERGMTDRELQYTEKMPKVKIPNFLFRNNGDSTFTDKAAEWGLDQPSCSQGAAYADLDNDGDLDLVTNNIDEEAFLYENKTIAKEEKNTSHFLRIVLKGKGGNTFGLGAKAFLYAGGKIQAQECMPTRGYLSSVDYRLHFGMANSATADSVIVVWNDGSYQRLDQVHVDQQLVLDQNDAKPGFDYSVFHRSGQLFERVTEKLNLRYQHKENQFVEFNREALIPHMLSAEGPAVAVGDVNNDGYDDIFLSGAKRVAGKIFLQSADGVFLELLQPALANDSVYEYTDAVFFDADNDSDKDLLVVSGGNEYSGRSKYTRPRLYFNDGKGNFSVTDALPEIFLNASCASVADVDADGDPDIFVGARSIPWRYGIKPDSYLLLNDGKGKFADATATTAPQLRKFGLVKNSAWADIDNDRDPDLVVAMEWAPITILINHKGKLELTEASGLENTSGWWNIVEPVDIDNDGDVDLVGGNYGLNSKLQPSPREPVRMYAADFDKNDSTDQIVTHYIKGKEYPFHTRDEMTRQMPFLKKKYLSYTKFAGATVHDMFTSRQLNNAEHYEANTFQTSVFENLGNGKFRVHPLPYAAQLSPVHAIVAEDLDGDRYIDLLLAGNFYPVNIQMGRHDAGYGLYLKGNGNGNFTPVPAMQSGFNVNGEVRNLQKIKVADAIYYLAVRNNNTVEAFTIKKLK